MAKRASRPSPKKSSASRYRDPIATAWLDERYRHLPANLIATIKEKKYIPLTGEVFYEQAWRARLPNIKKAIAQGRGNLSRTLSIFMDLDSSMKVTTHLAEIRGDGNQVCGRFFQGKVEIEHAEAAPARSGVEIIESTKSIVSRGVKIDYFPAEDQRDLIIEWLRQISLQEKFDAIVELGSGYGLNLFSLYCKGGPSQTPYYAGEYTKAGREMTTLLARVDRKAPVRPVFFDHQAPDLSFLKKARNILLFSCHSIEQVWKLPDNYFGILAHAAPKVTAVHLEPFGSQLGGTDPISTAHSAFMQAQSYNQNMVECMKKAEAAGDISIRLLSPNLIAPQINNPTSVALWDNSPLRKR